MSPLPKLAASPLGRLTCLGISFVKSVRTARLTRIYRDSDGDWIQSHRDATIACPELYLKRLESIQRKAERLWFRHYRPSPGDVIMDAGAGIGEDAIVFSRAVTPSGRVIAIEPHPRVFRCLEKTARQSGLANVVTLRCALQSSDGEVRMSRDEQYAANAVLDGEAGELVRARSIESLFAEFGLGGVDLLKMNIEGAEVEALLGMAGCRRAVRNIVVSCHDFLAERGGSARFRTRSKVVALLERWSFRILPSEADAEEDWARDYVYAAAAEPDRA